MRSSRRPNKSIVGLTVVGTLGDGLFVGLFVLQSSPSLSTPLSSPQSSPSLSIPWSVLFASSSLSLSAGSGDVGFGVGGLGAGGGGVGSGGLLQSKSAMKQFCPLGQSLSFNPRSKIDI